jgi:thymidylate synthase-like protein
MDLNSSSYVSLVDELLASTNVVDSRLGLSKELVGHQVTFFPGTLVYRPRLNLALGWMELLQLIGGVFDPEQIQRVAPNATLKFFTSMSAYGPRIYRRFQDVNEDDDLDYVQGVLSEVKRDPNSRRAVLFIAKPWDAPDELSCTLTYQFIVRQGRLHGIVSMRSWDVIRGLVYDIIMFGGLLQAAAIVLKLDLGRVTVTAGSLHLYESDLQLVPTVDRRASFRLNFPPDATWVGIKTVCKNQVHQDWGETKTPHFIEVEEWRES